MVWDRAGCTSLSKYWFGIHLNCTFQTSPQPVPQRCLAVFLWVLSWCLPVFSVPTTWIFNSLSLTASHSVLTDGFFPVCRHSRKPSSRGDHLAQWIRVGLWLICMALGESWREIDHSPRGVTGPGHRMARKPMQVSVLQWYCSDVGMKSRQLSLWGVSWTRSSAKPLSFLSLVWGGPTGWHMSGAEPVPQLESKIVSHSYYGPLGHHLTEEKSKGFRKGTLGLSGETLSGHHVFMGCEPSLTFFLPENPSLPLHTACTPFSLT